MNKEIERKFLLKDNSWKDLVTQVSEIEQHYLFISPSTNVRVRKKQKGDNVTYTHTIKEKLGNQESTKYQESIEIENDISKDTFLGLKELSVGSIFKTRHIIPAGKLKWEVDVFHGHLDGLVMAEIEIPSVDTSVDLPYFIGKEVSADKRYSNANLCSNDTLVSKDGRVLIIEEAPEFNLNKKTDKGSRKKSHDSFSPN